MLVCYQPPPVLTTLPPYPTFDGMDEWMDGWMNGRNGRGASNRERSCWTGFNNTFLN
uniref:Uncharacterized protein n=1 Tax=Picea glauca TaxID=3330 RepID=A0A101LVM1_PICGL|nr:hypothetical protein ABT39_MTgene1971 [Picea glauca]